MAIVVTIFALMQLLHVGIIAQSVVSDLSASASPDHSTALTLGVETLTPTPVLTSGVAIASVTASPPVVSVHSAASSPSRGQALESTLVTGNQAVSPTASNRGIHSTGEQTLSSTETNGGARNSISDQNVSPTTTNVGSSIHADNQIMSSTAGHITGSSNTGDQNTMATTGGDSTVTVSMAPGSDVIVPVAPSVFVSTTPMSSAVDATSATPMSSTVYATSASPMSSAVDATSASPMSSAVDATSASPMSSVVDATSASPMSSVVDATSVVPVTANPVTPPPSNASDGLASAGSTGAIISPTPSASQMTETSGMALKSSFNRELSGTTDVFSSSTQSMLGPVTPRSSAGFEVNTVSSEAFNSILSSSSVESHIPTIVTSVYLSKSLIPNSATVQLHTSKVTDVMTSGKMMSDLASSHAFVPSSLTDMSSPIYIAVSSSPFVSHGVGSSDVLKSYSSMTSNLIAASQTQSITISPTKASSFVQSNLQTTLPIVIDSFSQMSALSSSLFSQSMSSAASVGSIQSIVTSVTPPLVLTSGSAMVSLPVLPTVDFDWSSTMTATNAILSSSVLPVMSDRNSSANLSSFMSSLNVSSLSTSGTVSPVTPGLTVSSTYSMPLVTPSFMGTSTYLYSSMSVPYTNVTGSLASLSGTTLPLMTSVISAVISAPDSFGSSNPVMTSTRHVIVSEASPYMSPSTVSSLYTSSHPVSLNMSVVSPTLTMPVSPPSMYPTPTLTISQSSPSITLPILPTRSSTNMTSIDPSMMSSNFSFHSLRPVSVSSRSVPPTIPPRSVIPTGSTSVLPTESTSSIFTSDFMITASPASDYHMTSTLNISSFSLSSMSPSTNFPPMPLPSTNVNGSTLTIASSVISPSFVYSTDMYTPNTSTPLLVSQTPHSTMINLTRSVSILTPTVLPPAPSNMTPVDGTMSANLSTNSMDATMAITSGYSVNLTLMTSSAIIAPSGVNITTLLPTAIQPTPATQTPPSMNFTSAASVASSSLVMMDNTSALAPGNTSGLMSSMTSMVIPASATSSMSPMTSSTMSSPTQSSLVMPVVTESTIFTNMSSSQVPSTPPVVMPTGSMTPASTDVTSTSNQLNSSESAASILPTPSDISSLNTTTTTTTVIPHTSVPLMSSAAASTSINVTSTMTPSSITPSSNQSTTPMSSAVTMPTTSDVTTPTSVNVTATPALNVTVASSISTTPLSTISENVTASTMTLNNVTSVNATMTMSVNMTSDISANTTDSMSTSVVPVPTTPAPTTTTTTTEPPSTTNSFMATYWTVTDIKVPVSVNVSGDDFVNGMELGLANLYVEAYTRKQDIDAGSFDSRRRKRRRRAATVDDITVTMQDVTRDPADQQTVSMMYTVEKAELPVPSAANAETINLVSDQEMAIELRYVVTKKGKPLNWVEPVTTTTTVATTAVPSNDTQFWIIGVVAGGVLILIVIAIVGLCIATKKKKNTGVDEEAEPRLMNLKHAPLDDDEEDIGSSGRSNSKYSSMADKDSSSNLKVQSPKKQSYEVTSDTRSKEEDEHLYAEVRKPKKADLASKIGRSRGSSQDVLESENIAEDVELIESPKRKKGEKGRRKNKRKDGELEDEENEVITRTIHPANLLVPQSQPFTDNAYYSAEEEDELKKRKAAERKKNKQRIREKKKKEKHQDKSADQLMVEYLAAQEEIDSVLEAPPTNQDLPEVFIHKKKGGSKGALEGHDNMALSAEESLHVARSRMHELLDDAFSLISPSSTSIGEKPPPEDEGFHSPRTQSPRSTRSQLMLLNQRNLNRVYPADTDALTIGSEVILVDSRAPSPYSGHDIFLARSSAPVSSSESISVPEDTTSTGSYDVRGSSTMKHSPMKMEAYTGDPILQTWSPYRAADQVALISMPNKMQTSIGRTQSGRSKRPAADLIGTQSKGNMPKPAFLKSRDIISTKGSTADLSSTKSKHSDLASKAGKGKPVSSENTDEQDEEATEVLQPNAQFEDTEISKENSMLPSIRARKMAKAAKKRVKNGGGMEMKTMNGNVGHKHKEPFKTVPNGADEMDIISRSVQSAVTPASTVNSIRNEIRSGLPDKSVVTSFSGPGRSSQASGSLVDIA